MKVLPLELWHLDHLRVQRQQWRDMYSYYEPRVRAMLVQAYTVTFMDGDDILLCGGFFDATPFRAVCWALIAESLGRRAVPVFRTMRRIIGLHPAKRVEFTVDTDFPEAHRMARYFGMTLETASMPCYGAYGQEQSMYVRLKP